MSSSLRSSELSNIPPEGLLADMRKSTPEQDPELFNFIESEIWYHKSGVCIVKIEQSLLEYRELEKVVFFFNNFNFQIWMNRTLPIN